MSASEIIVVGAGVSGLSCAHELARAGRRVQVWTAAPPARTTSRVAAAFWHPYRAGPVELVHAWSAVSYERLASIAANLTLGPAAGVMMREVLEVFPARVPDPPWSRYVDMFRHAEPGELPPGRGHGIMFEAPVIEMPRYLGWLVSGLERMGVAVIERELANLAPALEQARVVVNATGLGARELVGDSRLYPVRGQILRRRREGLERVFIDEHGPGEIAYVIPRSEDIILGGVADEHDEDLRERPEQSAAILERCARLEPRLVDCEELEVLVGLRPCRDEVRLEQEEREGKLVVHNYGHGGSGVTLSWGCAEDVCARVLAWLSGG